MTRRIPTAIGAISLLICNYSAATPPNYGDGACLDASTCVSVGAKDVKNVGVDVFGSTNVDQLVGAIQSTLPTADTIVIKNTGKIVQTSVSALSSGTQETDIGLIRPGGAFDKIIINLSGGDVTNAFIGVGGVDSGKSAYEKFISGASYIQLYTGMVYQGPNIVNKISEELYEILNSKGVKNIEEIIGSK